MKIIEVIADEGHLDTIKSIAEHQQVDDIWFGRPGEDGRIATRMLVSPDRRQAVLDSLQNVLQATENARIIIIPIEATLPKPDIDEVDVTDVEKKKASMRSREEIFALVEKDAQLGRHYLLLVLLSAIVAAIGLLENNIAIVIGAMVIAPLLGPNLAFSLGTSLGDTKLIWDAFQTLFVGTLLAVVIAAVIGLLWPGQFDSYELLLRTDVGYSGASIALASGAAASLSLVTGTSGVLVGVMVAVALMPPAVTIGLMLSTGAYDLAMGAGLLLAVNIVCINLAAKLVFLFMGVKPRTWLQARKTRQSHLAYIVVWVILLVLLITTIYLRHRPAVGQLIDF